MDIISKPTIRRYIHHAIDNQKFLVRYIVNIISSIVEKLNHFLRFIINDTISMNIKAINSIKASVSFCESIADILSITDIPKVV